MTAPDGGQDQGQPKDQPAKDQGQPKAAPPKVKKLDTVVYVHRDPILGGSHQAVGVVSEVTDSGAVFVRPLERHHVQVDPADIVGVVTADDV